MESGSCKEVGCHSKFYLKIQLNGPTHAIAFDEKHGIIHVTYLPDSGITQAGLLNRVELINSDTNKVVGSSEINANPFFVIIDSENGKLYANIIKSGQLVVVHLKNQDIELGLTKTTSTTL